MEASSLIGDTRVRYLLKEEIRLQSLKSVLNEPFNEAKMVVI